MTLAFVKNIVLIAPGIVPDMFRKLIISGSGEARLEVAVFNPAIRDVAFPDPKGSRIKFFNAVVGKKQVNATFRFAFPGSAVNGPHNKSRIFNIYLAALVPIVNEKPARFIPQISDNRTTPRYLAGAFPCPCNASSLLYRL